MPASQSNEATRRYTEIVNKFKLISTVSLMIGIAAILIASGALYYSLTAKQVVYVNSTTTATTNSTTLAGINDPLNATQLAVINNAPDSYFATAAAMYLNNSLQNSIFPSGTTTNALVVNNKNSVVYLGSTTCIYCAENRWAMALALSRFGSFSALYEGYSSLGDNDVPTLYWKEDPLNTSSDVIGSYYTSSYVNFLPIEDTNPITGGFLLNPFSTIQGNVNATGNQTYINTLAFILSMNANTSTAFGGTPYTIWGNYIYKGADASDFGNSTNAGLQIKTMTHAQILKEFSNPNDQFGWTEYAAADIYIASLCKSLNNTAPACDISGISAIESRMPPP